MLCFRKVGSSPRVRAVVLERPTRPSPRRFIPACAGCGSNNFKFRVAFAVHPRVCGLWRVGKAVKRYTYGSSPRVRAVGLHHLKRFLPLRFIPACAGCGSATSGTGIRASVHPRVCGLWISIRLFASLFLGSSPRVRAVGSIPADACAGARFIPACAGCGMLISKSPSSRPVHPRVCGLWSFPIGKGEHSVGSSPRVRAVECIADCSMQIARFIPACAGCGSRTSFVATTSPVHPRVCGLWISIRYLQLPQCGSSPRVRAVEHSILRCLLEQRFIPACAGCGTEKKITYRRFSVHPRVCGLWVFYFLNYCGCNGSSPRVRAVV